MNYIKQANTAYSYNVSNEEMIPKLIEMCRKRKPPVSAHSPMIKINRVRDKIILEVIYWKYENYHTYMQQECTKLRNEIFTRVESMNSSVYSFMVGPYSEDVYDKIEGELEKKKWIIEINQDKNCLGDYANANIVMKCS